MRGLLISVSAIALMMPSGAMSTETVTYSYDAQGRLLQSVISGTVNNGQTSTTGFDTAGNRTNYAVSLNGVPPPPPPPPPANSPPTTVADTLTVPNCIVRTKDVTYNDSDPEGNVPLALVSVTNSNPARGTPYVLSASTIQYEAFITGSDVVTYTVSDSLGATSTGTLTVTVTKNQAGCIQLRAPKPPASATSGGGN